MQLEMASTPLTRALAVNSQNVAPFVYPTASIQEPGAAAALSPALPASPIQDGVVANALEGRVSSGQALILPIAAGGPGGGYLMRVYAWWLLGTRNDALNRLWIPTLLAEFLCVSGDRNGLQAQLMNESEFHATSITLTAGDLGAGKIVTDQPVAWIRLDLQGCQIFTFDFTQALDGSGSYGPALPNALYAKKSAL